MGVNGCQGTPWSEKLDSKELHGAAWWRLRSGAERTHCFLYIVNTVNPSFIICKCGIMLILKGWCLIDPLYCCTAVTGITYIGIYFFSRTVFSYVKE